MRNITNYGLELIKKFESFKAQLYYCPANVLTIGYGHVVIDKKPFLKGITKQEADKILLSDIYRAQKSILNQIKVKLNNNQYDALVSFTFNVGGAALQRSTLRQQVNSNDHHLVSNELKKWIWAGGRKLTGLIIRRQQEAILYES